MVDFNLSDVTSAYIITRSFCDKVSLDLKIVLSNNLLYELFLLYTFEAVQGAQS